MVMVSPAPAAETIFESQSIDMRTQEEPLQPDPTPSSSSSGSEVKSASRRPSTSRIPLSRPYDFTIVPSGHSIWTSLCGPRFEVQEAVIAVIWRSRPEAFWMSQLSRRFWSDGLPLVGEKSGLVGVIWHDRLSVASN